MTLTALAEMMPDGCIAYPQAAEKLKAAGYDLDKARDEAVKRHVELGIIAALQEKGKIKQEAEYRELFDNTQFSEAGLNNKIEGLQDLRQSILRFEPDLPVNLQEEKIRELTGGTSVVFDSGLLTFRELWDILIKKANILNTPVDDSNFNFRQFDPKNFPELLALNTSNTDPVQAEKTYRDIYNRSPQIHQSGPQVTFTDTIPRIKGVTPAEFAQRTIRGQKKPVLDPVSGLILWREQYDKTVQKLQAEESLDPDDPDSHAFVIGEALPDRFYHHVFPLHILPNGQILSWHWEPRKQNGLLLVPEFPTNDKNIRMRERLFTF